MATRATKILKSGYEVVHVHLNSLDDRKAVDLNSAAIHGKDDSRATLIADLAAPQCEHEKADRPLVQVKFDTGSVHKFLQCMYVDTHIDCSHLLVFPRYERHTNLP